MKSILELNWQSVQVESLPDLVKKEMSFFDNRDCVDRKNILEYLEPFDKIVYLRLYRPKLSVECYVMQFFEKDKIYEYVRDPVPSFRMVELNPWNEQQIPVSRNLMDLMYYSKQHLKENFKPLPDNSIRIFKKPK